jgi:enoyl-CoA hydratase/carnithine racemase
MPIDYQIEGRVAIFTINRLDILNALSLDALADLSEESGDFDDNPEPRAGMITEAEPKSYCSGMDLRSTPGLPTESLFAEGSFVRGLEAEGSSMSLQDGLNLESMLLSRLTQRRNRK